MKSALFSAAVAAIALTGAAWAQEGSDSVATLENWSVFVESNPKECWVAAQPKETVNTRGGQSVEVRRGQILLFVRWRPDKDVAAEVSFTGGYPFATDRPVSLSVGGKDYELPKVQDEWAWATDGSADAAIVAALKAGVDAVVTGRSERGTTTKDTFSLIGFTAATEEAAKRCAS
ncbi:MAG: invasion associated locus B family protein [Pseudomonadota bacterium]